MTEPLEILVHVSGPSQGRDDARYRAQARDFLAFEPLKRHDILRLDENGKDSIDDSFTGLDEQHDPKIHGKDSDAEVSALDERGRLGTEPFDQRRAGNLLKTRSSDYGTHGGHGRRRGQSFSKRRPSMNDRSSPGAHEGDISGRASTHFGRGRSSEVTDRERLSTIQEGFLRKSHFGHTPLWQNAPVSGSVHQSPKHAAIVLQTPTTIGEDVVLSNPSTVVKETPHVLIARTPALPRPQTAPTKQINSHDNPRTLRRILSDSWKTPPSTIPDSQPNVLSHSVPEMSSSQSQKRPLRSSSPSPTRNPPRSPKRPHLQVPSSPPTGEPADQIQPPSTSPQSSSPAPALEVTSSIHEVPSSPPKSSPISSQADFLQIEPPPPKTSNDKFTTHITPYLADLTTKLPLSRGFTPFISTQSRLLQTLERGHWLIPISTWELDLKSYFWESLQLKIGGGHCGWGVRAFGEVVQMRNGMEVLTEEEMSTTDSTPREKEEVAKIYCWGEVVGHIWLLLFIASRRGVRGVGSKWIDASGEAVLVMI